MRNGARTDGCRNGQRERLGRDAENREAGEEQREPAEKHGFVAEAGHEHSGRHVEQQYADAAQAHDQSCECRAVPKLEHVQRYQDDESLLAHRHQE